MNVSYRKRFLKDLNKIPSPAKGIYSFGLLFTLTPAIKGFICIHIRIICVKRGL